MSRLNLHSFRSVSSKYYHSYLFIHARFTDEKLMRRGVEVDNGGG